MKTAVIPERGKSCEFCRDVKMSMSGSRGPLQGRTVLQTWSPELGSSRSRSAPLGAHQRLMQSWEAREPFPAVSGFCFRLKWAKGSVPRGHRVPLERWGLPDDKLPHLPDSILPSPSNFQWQACTFSIFLQIYMEIKQLSEGFCKY